MCTFNPLNRAFFLPIAGKFIGKDSPFLTQWIHFVSFRRCCVPQHLSRRADWIPHSSPDLQLYNPASRFARADKPAQKENQNCKTQLLWRRLGSWIKQRRSVLVIGRIQWRIYNSAQGFIYLVCLASPIFGSLTLLLISTHPACHINHKFDFFTRKAILI